MHQSFRNIISLFASDLRGGIGVMFSLIIAALVMLAGFAVDFTRAELVRTMAQDALDSAVIGAVMTDKGSRQSVAKAVYASNSANQVALAATPTFTENDDGSVVGTVNVTVPTTFSRIAQVDELHLAVTSTASVADGNSFCVLAFASSGGQGIRTNGSPQVNLGCNAATNGSATCNGHDLGAPLVSAGGSNNGCGIARYSNEPKLDDPYDHFADQVPANTCNAYPQAPQKKNDKDLPESNKWSGNKSLFGNTTICGDLKLTGDVTISAVSGAVLIIQNGHLDLNGYKLQTANGSGLTIVFAGTNSAQYDHIIMGSGTLDIAAPTSGTWSGVTIYQIPTLKTNVDMSYSGNDPSWKLSGLVYLPNSNMTFSGAVGKSAHGASCFVVVVNTLLVNGTGSIFDNNNQCAAAGLAPPRDQRGAVLSQ